MKNLLAAFSTWIICGSLHAHDLWLIPPEKTSGETKVRISQGMDFPKSTGAPNTTSFVRAVCISPSKAETKLVPQAADGDDGCMSFTLKESGLHWLAVDTAAKQITLEAAAFNAYLVSDGLPHIYKLRHDAGELHQPGRERYSKCVKALLRHGDANEGAYDQPLGQVIEIVPLDNPLTRKPGDTLKVRVLFKNKPLTDANLGWCHPGDGEQPRGTVRTDAAGEALIPVARSGLMTIRLTHMTRPKHQDYEWESFWSTLTFRVDR